MKTSWIVVLVVIGVLLAGGLGVGLFFLLRDDDDGGTKAAISEVDLIASATNRQEFIDDHFQFKGMYPVDPVASAAVNACASGSNPVFCSDTMCSNCVCPEVCQELGMRYMMMDQQTGNNEFRCSCAHSISDFSQGSAISDSEYANLTPVQENGDVWKKVNQWKSALLPPVTADSRVFNFATGGLYPITHAFWGADAINKVFIGNDTLGAVYEWKNAQGLQTPSATTSPPFPWEGKVYLFKDNSGLYVKRGVEMLFLTSDLPHLKISIIATSGGGEGAQFVRLQDADSGDPQEFLGLKDTGTEGMGPITESEGLVDFVVQESVPGDPSVIQFLVPACRDSSSAPAGCRGYYGELYLRSLGGLIRPRAVTPEDADWVWTHWYLEEVSP